MRCTPGYLNECFETWLKFFQKDSKKLILVGVSALLWAIWRCRNNIVFDRKMISDPMGIVKMMCGWISDWAVLQKRYPGERMLMLGANLIVQVASEVYKSAQGWRYNVPRLHEA